MKLSKSQIDALTSAIHDNIVEKNNQIKEEYFNNPNSEGLVIYNEVKEIIEQINTLKDKLENIAEENKLLISHYSITNINDWKSHITNKFIGTKLVELKRNLIERKITLATIEFDGTVEEFIDNITKEFV